MSKNINKIINVCTLNSSHAKCDHRKHFNVRNKPGNNETYVCNVHSGNNMNSCDYIQCAKLEYID